MGKQSKFRRVEDIGSLIRSELLPTFKIARDAILQFAKVERDLFTDMEEAESGNFIISVPIQRSLEHVINSLG